MGKNKNSTTLTLRVPLVDAAWLIRASELSGVSINALMAKAVHERAQEAQEWVEAHTK
jgi:predicted HicB family RNase H-like nuclease